MTSSPLKGPKATPHPFSKELHILKAQALMVEKIAEADGLDLKAGQVIMQDFKPVKSPHKSQSKAD
jgi:hypothetical protein